MKTFIIDSEYKISARDSRADAEQNAVPSAAQFSSIDELAQLAHEWPLARLVAVWNGLPGLTPVSKFTDRKTAITRIWKALQDPRGIV
jgi:NAD-dependent oxidoreductase involved in siderophore biosynthesis